MTYDASGAGGNVTAEGAYYTYTYDAENRIVSASGTSVSGGPYCYTYDADGMRVMKSHGSSCATVDLLYWRNIAGQTIAETDGTGSTTNTNYFEYVFFAGRRVARSHPNSGSEDYFFVDHLGSTRAMTHDNGTKCFEADYLPYGEEKNYLNSCSSVYKFTGYEYDGETANYYAFARYYSLRTQRFLSADPLAGGIGDPQSLNRYAYVGNNPINRTDPTGMFWLFDFFKWIFGGGRHQERGGRGGVSIGIGIGIGGGSGNAWLDILIAKRNTSSAPQRDPRIGSEPFPDGTLADWLDSSANGFDGVGGCFLFGRPGDEAAVAFWGQFWSGLADVWRNYRILKNRGNGKFDKYYHCMGNCEAVSRGPGGTLASWVGSEIGHEVWQDAAESERIRNINEMNRTLVRFGRPELGVPQRDSPADRAANRTGRNGAPDCAKACAQYPH